MLSNESSVRAASISAEPIAYEAHVEWYNRFLSTSGRLFLLFFEGTSLAGQIRFVLEEDCTAELSISVDIRFRGKGLASRMVVDALDVVKARWNSPRIRALVKTENSSSNHLFVKSGFVFSHSANIKGKECNVYYFDY
jgi:RimJ/RimL family protein N-acetyltransferase